MTDTTFRFSTPRCEYNGPMKWADRPTCESCSDFRPLEHPQQFNVNGIITLVELGDCKAQENTLTPRDNKACRYHSAFRKD